MKVLKFLVHSTPNLLAESIVNYLIDAGHRVVISNLDEVSNLKWKTKYKHNLHIVDQNSLNLQKIDYTIDLDNLLPAIENIAPKIYFNLQIVEDKFCVAAMLECEKHSAVVGLKKLGYLSELLPCDLQYLVNEVTEVFIDAIIYLLRSGSSELIIKNMVCQESLDFNLIKHILMLEKLNNSYKSIEDDNSVFLIENLVIINDKDAGYLEHKLILPTKLSSADLEILTLYLLTLINSRQKGIYGYDLYFPKLGSSSKNNKLSKFIKVALLDFYNKLLSKCQDDLYSITDNDFCSGFVLQNSKIKPQVLIAYDSKCADDTYMLLLEYNPHTDTLTIKYKQSLYFFNDAKEHIDNFFHKFSQFRATNMTFFELLSFSQLNFNSDIITKYKTTQDSFHNQTIHHLFEVQVEQTPDKIAVVQDNMRLSYGELNKRSNQLANYILQTYSIKPDALIAIFLDKSEYMLIVMLGILKAGGAYVPIDPSYPDDRIKSMLEDTKLVISCERYQERLKGITFTGLADLSQLDDLVSRINILPIDSLLLRQQLSLQLETNPQILITSDNLVYVIYTSGTTGLPKGVMITHKGIVNLALMESQELELPGTSNTINCLVYSNYVFDAHVWEIYAPIINGHTIHMINDNIRHDLLLLNSYIKSHHVAIATIPPALLNNQDFLSLDTMVVMGDKTIPEILVQYSNNKVKLINAYGPTEITVCATLKHYDNNLATNIGSSLGNIKCYVLDNNLIPLPIGVIGELYIGGVGVARGYFNKPDITAEKFIANPFQTEEERKLSSSLILYKTGDLVRRMLKGDLEYIGRNDFQVKIRGYRIELEEIENALMSYTQIKQAVVIAKERIFKNKLQVNDKYLVAYYVSNNKLDENQVMAHLKSKLPDYMLPVALVHLDKLSLTINGKLDQKALPDPEFTNSHSYVKPRNALENKVCIIWESVLGLPDYKIGIRDDFFVLGGDSVAAIHLVSKLNNEFNSDIKITDIFNLKTIEKVSNVIRDTVGNFVYKDYLISQINDYDLFDPFPLTNVQQAYYLGRFSDFELGNISTHVYGEYKFHYLNTKALERSFNQLMQRHLALRTKFTNNQQQYLKEYPYYKIEVHELSSEAEIINIRNALSHKIYDPEHYPLFDIVVSKFENNYILHISFDALIIDMSSFQLLSEEWTKLYNNPNIILPTLEISYRDYVLKFENIRSGILYQNAKKYWINKIDDYDFSVGLPLVTDPSNIKKPKFARVSRVIKHEIWNKVLDKAQQIGISPTTLILEIYGKVLAYWSNQNKICINLTLFNRLPLHQQINNIVGDFTVLELFDYTDNDHKVVSQVLQNTHNQLWSDIEHNLFDGIDFQRLVKNQRSIPTNKIIAPIVLTSIIGGSNRNHLKHNAFELPIDDSYQGLCYSITQTSQVWLDNKVYENDVGLVAEWDYVEQLFSLDVIQGMHDLYCDLIEDLAELDWDVEYFSTTMISKKDQKLIEHININEQLFEINTLYGRYESVARDSSINNKIAVIDSGTDKAYSYKQLLEDTELLAKYIFAKQDLCNKNNFITQSNNLHGKLIGILSEKGYNHVVGTLSIMKSGHGYLPLNMGWPLGRLEEILNKANVSILLISRAIYNQPRIKEFLEPRYQLLVIEDILFLTHTDNALVLQLKQIVLPQVKTDDIAYVIFTSGSTGEPKGVTISHKGALNTIDAVNNKFNLTARDSILALSELSFDLSVYDIFGILAVGGTIIFPTQDKIQHSAHWLDLINKYRITIWDTVPQLAALLLEEVSHNYIEKGVLRLFLLSGDWIPTNLPETIRRYCNDTTIVSLGGATEGSIWSIWYEIQAVDKQWSSIPYGVAMPNQKIYVLNYKDEYCPPEVTGEIYIGGTGVALNYWEDEVLTSHSFIEHKVFGRLYKTGDLGRYNRNGYIEFIGRKDSQVKLNGYRVELSEISAKLVKLQGIKDAVVKIQRENCRDDIIAYLLTTNHYQEQCKNIESTPNSLKQSINQELSKVLPDYMIPYGYVIIEKLPISANGKLEVSKLPAFQIKDSNIYLAPRDELESKICQIWSSVLGITEDKIGVEDNFFQLGGNSINAIRLASKINREFNRNIAVDIIFRQNTVAKLVQYLKYDITKYNTIDKTFVFKPEKQLLSYAQERLWFIEKYEEGTNAYNLPIISKLAIDVKLDVLKHAIRNVVKRHEILRTVIREDNGGNSYQLVLNEEELQLEINDVVVHDKAELDYELGKLVNHVYDLSTELPIKACIYKLCGTSADSPRDSIIIEYYLGIVVHHIAFDGWSLDIFLNDLQAYYSYFLKQSNGLDIILDLPELTIQYKDFALWQRHYLSGEMLESQIVYWKNKLHDYEPLNLISDKSRPHQTDYAGADSHFILDADISRSLRELAKELKVSLYSVLLAGYYLMLRVYSSQDDIVIGTPVANRHYNQIDSLIGFFVNSLALRIKVDPQISVKQFIQAVSHEVINAQLYQDLPFEKLVEVLKVPKDTSRHPIFQVMFGVHDFGNGIYREQYRSTSIRSHDILIPYVPEEILLRIAQFDISTFIDDSGDILHGSFNYAVNIYTEGTIKRFIETYTMILIQMSSMLDSVERIEYTQISDLQYINQDQYQEIVNIWNETNVKYPIDQTIQSVFESQVQQTPHAIAMLYNGAYLTYAQLNIKANRLAHYLRQKNNISPDTLIALFLDRSEYMLIAILGVLKAGGAYVPIDPTYPDDRIRYILEDTNTKLVLTNEVHKQRLENCTRGINSTDKDNCYNNMSNRPTDVISLDNVTMDAQLLLQPTTNPGFVAQSTDLAYVIYTSGTTGVPKGVMIEHRGIINLKCDLTIRYKLGDKNGQEFILLFANYVFDTSVEQIILSLLNGYTLVLMPHQLWGNKEEFYNYLNINKVTHIEASPTFLQQYDCNRILNLQRLICGGEQLNKQFYDNIQLTRNTVMVNSYGPTEASITSVVNIIQDDKDMSIGMPIANTQCYVLDNQLRPVPVGVSGELYIGGVGLARGYLNRPDLTSEKFIANPFLKHGQESCMQYSRLYKTGDVVRWLPTGKLDYIGRNDFQVKIRGYRIELQEIENILSSYVGVLQSVVLAKNYKANVGMTTNAESKYLVGYYVSDEVLDEKEIIGYLQTKLPDYMVPAVFVHLNNLPLTINGKLDRKALPDPILTETEDYVAPRDEMEYKICRIWSEVLGVSVNKISITDDFFRLGGDSIISIQLVSRLRQKLDLKVNVKDIFECKTISKLYDNVLSKNSFGTTTGMLVQNEQGVLTGELRLLPIQEWFFKSNFRMENHWNQSFILKTPELDVDKLRSSFAMLIDYHDNFRLRYNKCNNGSEICTQYYDKNAQPEELKILDIKDFGSEEDSKAFDVCMQSMLTKWQSNFNLEHGPTYCIGYVHGYKDSTARIYFALHHLIIDTVSWRILIEDLYTLYTGGKLHSKGTSYRQWANVLRRYYINDESVAIQERQYWHNILSDYDNNIFKGSIINEKKNNSNHFSINLSSDKTVQLLRETNRAYNSEINDILLTSLAYVLLETTGQKFNHIILEGHGREELENEVNISRTVGWYTTMYPVRLELDHDIASSIKSIKENLKKVPNKGIGYGVLIGYEPNNLPKISFNYLGQLSNVGTVNTKNDWHIVSESTGTSINPLNINSNVIDINCAIISGQFQCNVTSKLGKKITKQIAKLFIQKLDEIIEHTTHQTRNYLTVSDIDNIISAKYLDKLQELRDIEGVYLCNSLQQGLIYHYLNQGEVDDAYRSQLIWKYNTLLDVHKLKEAWVYAQKRFDSLRLRFAWTDELVQIIDKEGSLNWIYIDLSGEKDGAIQKLKIEQIIDKDIVEMYDLELGGVFRVYIIKQDEDLYTCILSNHHIILDGWSNSVLLDYVHKTYSKLLNKESISLPVDNSYKLSQKYIQQNQTEHKDYWNQYIAQILEKGDLRGLLSPESKFNQVRIEEYKHVKDTKIELCMIKDDVYQKLKMLCKEESVTLNAILQYVWHKSLSIFGNSLQTVVGTTVSGRNLPVNNIENAVGLYINTLPLIVDHQNYADIGIIEAIKTIQDHINEINTRSNINLAELHESGERLFDNLFVYENYPSTLNEKESARLNISFESWRDTLDYPMAVIAYELDNQMTFKLQYAGEIFDQSMIPNLLSVTQKLLEQISDTPKKKVRELFYLNERQYSQITTLWNKSTKNPSNNGLIHELFEAQAEMFPERVAIVWAEVQLTYQELDDRANNLANYMRELYEIRPDTIVTLCLDKSEYMLIAVLSVLKAGGAYVAIDPSYPDDRINYILKDTSTTIILTNEKYHQRLQSIINPDIGLTKTKSTIQGKIISIDNAMVLEQLSMQVATKPKIMTTSDNLAYVIYTSGTTGNPKGVMQVHGNIIRLFTSTKSSYGFTNDDIWTLFHSYVFDFSVWEIWGALIYGGKLVIASYEQTRDFNMFYELCKKQRVTVLNQTPSVFYQFSDLVTSGDTYYMLTSLRYIIFGGEALNVSQLKRWFSNYGYSKPELVNMYGITETTVHVTQKPIREGDLNQNSYIGRSIADLQAYVLDRHFKLLPIGATGELYVGGAGLARGYLNRPELTAEKFIANPFYAGDVNGSDKNFRLYKTGDLVRLLASGELEYVGRNDSQVKIRGYRIELEEIENVILSYQGIKQTTVLAKNHTSADKGGLVSNKYLVCYYVSENKLNEEKILRHMRSKLPEYMIPTIIIHLNSLPLTINGKLDISALPETQLCNVEMSYIAPSNNIEKEMCHIWSEVLRLDAEKISVNNDFFRLGGDSILAIKLASKINTVLKSKINIASIFKHRTVKQLSIYLQNNAQHSQNSTYYEF